MSELHAVREGETDQVPVIYLEVISITEETRESLPQAFAHACAPTANCAKLLVAAVSRTYTLSC